MPPWAQAGLNYDKLPSSPYPILPPPKIYFSRAQSRAMLPSSSSTNTETDTVMSNAQDYDDEGE
ncbi:hypothetical protein FRC00_006348, partial [Tulasnella sp. 408]